MCARVGPVCEYIGACVRVCVSLSLLFVCMCVCGGVSTNPPMASVHMTIYHMTLSSTASHSSMQ